ncbi:exonuclease [Rhizobium bangladeshense]|uniref:lambda exonuclease family protein n=1 Tax=Rhizobium bangladeshense TaxID=1138189 RepID=UPI001C82F7B4|nr:lambda exonuclease family protein [Rhizobium bangladeshense]MBX4870618.1 exonuclease [Rhizobium bangladeshense]MBX4872667.1 exonuclease [Rhizobium bangladeshense]
MMEVFDIDQGDDAWFQARLGLPTASKFSTVMAKGDGKTRSEYMRRLAGEIITGEPSETYQNAHMERGKVMEDEAREKYAFVEIADIRRVGFIKNGRKGASPDSLVGNNGGLEIKTAAPHIQIDRIERDRLPPEHKAQVQGNLWLSEREWWDFVSYWPKLPMLIVRVPRDEDYIKIMADEVDRFNDELAALVDRVRRYGAPPAEIADVEALRNHPLMAG